MPLPTELVLFRSTPPVALPQAPLRITVPEAWRAEAYRPELEHARLTFDAYAVRRPRVAPALGDRSLIERLAVVLDDYLAPCVVADVNAFARARHPRQTITEAMYLQYVGTCLQAAEDPYRPSAVSIPAPPTGDGWAGLEPLFGRYPLMRYMLSTMTEQFVNSVLRCCDRLLEDWTDIGTFFFNAALAALTEIVGTGSDFHKGGQQVLLLTLRDTGNALHQLVYKPSDVERDFRIVGDTQALTAVINNLPAVAAKGVTPGNLLNNPGGSLVEMVATLAAQDQVTIPVTKYKILPVHPGSSLPVQPGGGYDIRQSYGWIEFLSSTAQDRDFADAVALTDYYQAYGALVALAYVFQITDMHQENVILHQQRPHLIDLEMAYSGIIPTPGATSLRDAYNRFAAPILQRVVDGWNTPQLAYGAPQATEPTKNQPYLAGQPYTPQPNDASTVMALFNRTVTLILNHSNAFDGWLAAASGVVSRLVPFGTAELLVRLRAIHNPSSYIPAFRPDEVLVRTRELTINVPVDEGSVAGWGDQFVATTNGVAAPFDLVLVYYRIQPRFAFWFHGQTAEDFIHGDVPAFYQKSNTGLALDSRGAPVPVDFDQGIKMTLPVDQATLANRLTQVWGTAPLLPSTYFPGGVTAVQRTYLAQLQNNVAFRGPRIATAQQDILGW